MKKLLLILMFAGTSFNTTKDYKYCIYDSNCEDGYVCSNNYCQVATKIENKNQVSVQENKIVNNVYYFTDTETTDNSSSDLIESNNQCLTIKENDEVIWQDSKCVSIKEKQFINNISNYQHTNKVEDCLVHWMVLAVTFIVLLLCAYLHFKR